MVLDKHSYLDEGYLDDWDDDPEDPYYQDDIDEETGYESFVRLAADVEAGRAEMPRGWKFDRPSPGVLVWTTPSGRRYAYDLEGRPLPLP
jgi:hypothetical protein